VLFATSTELGSKLESDKIAVTFCNSPDLIAKTNGFFCIEIYLIKYKKEDKKKMEVRGGLLLDVFQRSHL
jgi:hypothetical protein